MSRKREREREKEKEKNPLFLTNLHLKVLRMLKSFIQVGKLRHRAVTFLAQRDTEHP